MWGDIWRERYVSLAFCLLYWDSYKRPHSFTLLDLIKTLCDPLGCTYNYILLHTLHKQLLYIRINGNSLTIPVQLCPSAGWLLLQKHRHGTHNKHLGPLSRTCVNNEPGYPQSSRVDLGARSGSVTNGGVCECQGTRAVNPPERHQYEGPRMLIGEARVHK